MPNREDLDAKLELNTHALRFIPIPTVVFRQAVLLSLKGDHDAAARMFSRIEAIYPNSLPENRQRLERMALEDPAAFAALAAEARRRYRP